jgi:hypothetical protein
MMRLESKSKANVITKGASVSELKSQIDDLIKKLIEERDELRVQLHLAKMEAGSEWSELEAKLAKLEVKAKDLSGATSTASKDIGSAAKLLAEEIGKGFKKIAAEL